MRINVFHVLILFISAACVDRIDINTGKGISPVVISGYISNQPGPYRIEVAKAIDIDAKLSVKNLISVKKLVISDNLGTSEILKEIEQGIYETNPSGIQGEIGRSYKIYVELLDGRIYESKPDTIVARGEMDSVYFKFKSEEVDDATQYGFDIFFDSHGDKEDSYRYLWKLTGTYQIETNPELYAEPCGQSTCPKPRACSGYVVNGSGSLVQVGPCECCTCWIGLNDALPIISDSQFIRAGQFRAVNAGYIPLNEWIFMHKVYAEVRQYSLSAQAFAFWKAALAQKSATSSLFQPITGRIPNNFVQLGGPSGQIEGLFYATAITSKSVFINRLDVPNQGLLKDPDLKFKESCVQFGNATTERPSFWY